MAANQLQRCEKLLGLREPGRAETCVAAGAAQRPAQMLSKLG